MEVRPVDPRDTQWEIDRPRYRVYFWTQGASDEYELSGVDVDGPAVLGWADGRARELGAERFDVYAVVDVAGRGLVRVTSSGATASS